MRSLRTRDVYDNGGKLLENVSLKAVLAMYNFGVLNLAFSIPFYISHNDLCANRIKRLMKTQALNLRFIFAKADRADWNL